MVKHEFEKVDEELGGTLLAEPNHHWWSNNPRNPAEISGRSVGNVGYESGIRGPARGEVYGIDSAGPGLGRRVWESMMSGPFFSLCMDAF